MSEFHASPLEQLRPSAVNTRAGSHTGGVPNCVIIMHGRLVLGVSVGMSVAELRSGLGVDSTGASTGTGPGTGALSGAAVALVEERGMQL